MLEGLALGTVEAVIGPPEFIVGVDPRFQIVGAPGLIKDMHHAVRLTQDPKFREALFGFGEAKGIKGIGLVMYGANVWATRKPVQRLADFKGMKVRVLASQMHTVPLERIGATGVPMAPSEAVQALSSGAIDGVRTGFTFSQAAPRRPASYAASSDFTITPSCPRSSAVVRKRSAAASSAVSSRGTRSCSGSG